MKIVVAIALCSLAASCTSVPPPVPEAQPIELRVMTFNIEWGGTNVSFENVVAAIRLSDADIVGIQEAQGNLARLAGELGWHYDLQNYVLSRFPIMSPPDANRRFVYIEVRPDSVVALANVHLPSDPYGPDLVRDGGSLDDLIEIETRTRLGSIRPYLDSLAPLMQGNTPVFLTGDFNAPSHADWQQEMVGARSHIRYAVDWPVSRAVEAAGFNDSWRVAHPDPGSKPGLTWWAGRPPLQAYAPGANDPQDRIDFVWVGGPAETMASELVGEPGAEDVTLSVTPWPSDHRAVASTFLAKPARTPRLVSPDRRIFGLDDDIVIAYRNAPDSSLEIPGIGSYKVSGSGELRLAAQERDRKYYDVELHTPGQTVLRSGFWVVDRSAIPTVKTSRTNYDVGEPIDISWRNGPGNRNDYLGIYEIGIESAYIAGYDGGLTWLYVNAEPEGTLQLSQDSSQVAWPLPAGRYVARLLKDDGYEVLAESQPFVVR